MFKKKKQVNFNERIAMSIINSPNSYGSTANARMMLGRTATMNKMNDSGIVVANR